MIRPIVPMLALVMCFDTLHAATPQAQLQFDGKNAMEKLRAQCAFGPRVPGTIAHQKAAQYLVEQLQVVGLKPEVQRFKASPALLNGKTVEMMNIAGRLNPGQRAIVISAHWDTRPIADKDLSAPLRHEAIMGANDGASGVAVVLELARVLALAPPKCSVVFVLLDGEDLGADFARNEWCLGSKRFVSSLDPAWNVQLAINIDMVGDSSLSFTREQYAAKAAPEYEQLCWNIGQSRFPESFIGLDKRRVLDDHIPFLRAQIPAFNLIDLDYPYWHTTLDTTDKCSPASLQTAGRAVEAMIRHLDTIEWPFSVLPLPEELRGQ